MMLLPWAFILVLRAFILVLLLEQAPGVVHAIEAGSWIWYSLESNVFLDSIRYHDIFVDDDPAAVIIAPLPVRPFNLIFLRHLQRKEPTRMLNRQYKMRYAYAVK
jgi:hypothetical protein